MALDEPKGMDEIFDVDEFRFVVDKVLSQQTGDLAVDFVSYGFTIKAEHELIPAGSGCSGCSCKREG